MNSPFDNYNTHIIMYLAPYLNPILKTYHNIITLSSIPDGPLQTLVTKIQYNQLSSFQSNRHIGTIHNCINVLLRYPISEFQSYSKNMDGFMNDNDIPVIFSYLQGNGYIIDNNLTELLLKTDSLSSNYSNSNNRKMICMIRYNP